MCWTPIRLAPVRAFDLYKWHKLRVALDSDEHSKINQALLKDFDDPATAEETCKLIDTTLEDLTEGLINLSIDDITCPPSRRLSKAGHELFRVSPEKITVFKEKLAERLSAEKSVVSSEILSKMNQAQIEAEEAKRKKAETAKLNIPQIPSFTPGKNLSKNLYEKKGENVHYSRLSNSVLKIEVKDSSEGPSRRIVKLPKLAVKIMGDKISPILKNIPEEKEVFEFANNDGAFGNLCMQLQEQLLKGPDTFPGYWRNGERVCGAQLPTLSHFKKKPAFDINVYKSFVKKQRLEHVSKPVRENTTIKINSFNSFLSLRDKRIEKPKWMNEFVNKNKMIITFGWVIINNEPVERRSVVFRRMEKFPEKAWRMHCLCVYCRWQKYQMGFHVPHTIRPEGRGEQMAHPAHFRAPPKIEICWGMKEWNNCRLPIEAKSFEFKSFGKEEKGTRLCPCCNSALKDYVLAGGDWLEDADL